MIHSLKAVAVITLAGLSLSQPAHAGIWFESVDAGQNGTASAQIVTGVTPLTSIQGILGNNGAGGDDVDVYAILITDYQNFSAISTGPLDTMLFLFNADGTGQVMNDDYNGFNGGLTNQGVFSNGLYYIAISKFNNHPQDASNINCFGSTPWPGPLNNQIQPNASAGAFDHWTQAASSRGGGYEIFFTGTSSTPAPGALASLALAGMIGTRRRRCRI